MNLPTFFRSLRETVRPTLVMAASLGGFLYLALLGSSTALPRLQEAPAFLREPPRAVEALLGGSVDFFSPAGWLSSALLHPITVALLTAGALVVAAGSVATELERQTVDLVLARPVRRSAFLLAKAGAAVTTVGVVAAGGLAGALAARLTLDGVDELPVTRVVVALGGAWVLFVFFAMVAVLISARSSLRGRAAAAAVGVVVGSFFANFLALLFDEVRGLRFASAFHYFRPADILSGHGAAADLAVLAGGAAVALGLAVGVFGARDLTR